MFFFVLRVIFFRLFTSKIAGKGGKSVKTAKKDVSSKQQWKYNQEVKEEDYGAGKWEMKDGGIWSATNYKYKTAAKTEEEFKEQFHKLVTSINEDAMTGNFGTSLDNVGAVIQKCENCQFKVESNREYIRGCQQYEFFKLHEGIFPMRNFLLEDSTNVSVQISYVKSTVNILNCTHCQLFITHRAPVIEIFNCKHVKISICKEALSYFDTWEHYTRADSDATIIYKEICKQEIADGMIKASKDGINKQAVDDEKESGKILRWMNNMKKNEKWVLISRSVNEPNISVSMTSGLEMSINYFGKAKPLDTDNETWLDYNAPYQTTAKFDLINGKMKMDLVNL